jgi:SP family general alpha glucoside:H+ symporter-like MFS transporter
MADHNNVIDASMNRNAADTNNSEFRALVTQAQTSADLDSKLTVMEALKKHKKAVFWAMILSTSLVMEGYDLVIVSFHTSLYRQYTC